MTLSFLVPTLLAAFFVSWRSSWILTSPVVKERAHEVFRGQMLGTNRNIGAKIADAAISMQWRVDEDPELDGLIATCIGGRPVKVGLTWQSRRPVPLEGHSMGFGQVAVAPGGDKYVYDMGADDFKTWMGMFVYAGKYRAYQYRVIRALKKAGNGDISIRYPISWGKIIGWSLFVIWMISLAAG